MEMKGSEEWKEMIAASSKETLRDLESRCSKCASYQLGESVRLDKVTGKSMKFG